MPQLDISTYCSQVFWLIVSLSLLYVFLAKKFIPNIKHILSLRDQKIAKLIQESQKIHEQAVAQEAQYQSQVKALQEQLRDISKECQDTCAQHLHEAMLKLKSNFEAEKIGLLSDLQKIQDLLDQKSEILCAATEQILTVKLGGDYKNPKTTIKSTRQSMQGLVDKFEHGSKEIAPELSKGDQP